MSAHQHKLPTAGRWNDLTLLNRRVNIGSEISRAIKRDKKGNKKQKSKAIMRGLDISDLTI